MNEDLFIAMVLYFIWIAICTSEAVLFKVIRWTIMALFIFTPASQMGVNITFKLLAFVVIFAPVLLKNLIIIIRTYRRI